MPHPTIINEMPGVLVPLVGTRNAEQCMPLPCIAMPLIGSIVGKRAVCPYSIDRIGKQCGVVQLVGTRNVDALLALCGHAMRAMGFIVGGFNPPLQFLRSDMLLPKACKRNLRTRVFNLMRRQLWNNLATNGMACYTVYTLSYK